MNDHASLIATDHIQVEVTIRLGGTKMSVAEIARLRPDDIVTLNQSMTEGSSFASATRSSRAAN
ncbi:FliM/FliN family flagellar motor C-terminal domain-containing protein [Paracoccus cavernae]|uniref:FliM/FliN family flagellar motor C-terminal domain-containing protein n=1 Tax=Paracoccus cavernae TaxID=1571207 RepID=A0ABT8D9D1_9RHOB|nr:FliM/FliN family flagellar motor C-terminal domain-containing protein [Paracoccus cavernae]